MKRDNRVGPALLADGALPKPKRMTRQELGEWVGAAGRSVLDLRSDAAGFMESHVKGALFAPRVGGKLSVVAGSYVDEHDRILLLLEAEDDLEAAVRELVRIGFDHVEGWMPIEEALKEDSLTESIRRISTADLEAELADHPGAVVLDVRGAGEFAAGHVTGATNVAYTRLAARIGEIPAGDPLLVHCGSGLRASMATAYLVREGREAIHVDGFFGDISKKLRE
jgi:hydroxyacylglutathione hydrolase